VHSWSFTLSYWHLKVFPYSTSCWQLSSDWGNVPLVYEIKCQPTSAVLASAVLLCLSMSLCNTIPSSLGVSSKSCRCENWNYHSSEYEDYRRQGCDTVRSDINLPVFTGKYYIVLTNLKVVYLCPHDCFQIQFKLRKLLILWSNCRSKFIYINFNN